MEQSGIKAIGRDNQEWERTFDGLPDLIAILDERHRVVRVNRAMAQRLGTTPDKCVGLHCHQVVHGLKSPPAFCPHSRSMADGKEHVAEVHEERLGGDFLVSTTPLRDQQGKLVGSVHVARDITERKRIEEALRQAKERLEARVRERTAELTRANAELQSEIAERKLAAEALEAQRKRFNDVLEMVPAYVVLLSPDYRVPFANRFFEQRFGKSEGRRCYEYLFNRTEPCENCETFKVLKTHAPHHWEWTGPDGRNYDIHDFPFTDTDGSPMIMEMGIDITERKRAEEALRVAGAYNRGLIEAGIDPLVTIGPDGKITDVNAATVAATGYGREELIGTDFLDYFTEPDKARAGYQQVFREGSVRDYALEIRHRDGRVTPVLYNASVYRNEAGAVVGVFAAARDISERRRAEALLKEANESLERRVGERTAELRQSQADLDRAQAVGHMGWWRLDVGRNVLTWSDENHRIFGVPKGMPMTYEFFLSTVHPDDRTYVDRMWAAGLKGEPYDIEHRIVVDGQVQWVREKAYLEFDQAGALRGGFGITQDITIRKRAEEELRKARDELELRVRERTADLERAVDLLRDEVAQRIQARQMLEVESKRLISVLNMIPGFVAIKDRRHKIRFASHGFVEVFGEVRDRPCHQAQRGRDEPCEHCILQRVLDSQRPEEHEETYGGGRSFHVASFPFVDLDGEAVLLELGVDITERRRLERLVSHTSELERRRIGRDLHDTLGQRLTGVGYIVGAFSEKLSRRFPDDGQLAEQIIAEIGASIAQVRALARGLDPVGMDKDSFAAALGELAAGVQATSGIRCRFDGDLKTPVPESAMTNLYRIAQEAMNNAVKHAGAKSIKVSLRSVREGIELAVKDDGAGIPAGLDPHKGMGLRVMRHRAGAIGAEFSVRHGKKGGTVVTCRLPGRSGSS